MPLILIRGPPFRSSRFGPAATDSKCQTLGFFQTATKEKLNCNQMRERDNAISLRSPLGNNSQCRSMEGEEEEEEGKEEEEEEEGEEEKDAAIGF